MVSSQRHIKIHRKLSVFDDDTVANATMELVTRFFLVILEHTRLPGRPSSCPSLDEFFDILHDYFGDGTKLIIE